MPSKERVEQANITRFMSLVSKRRGLKVSSYNELYNWSIENIPDFWAEMWDFADIRASRGYDSVVDELTRFPGARWFVGSRLNFAENLLRHRDNRLAFIFKAENQRTTRMTYVELYHLVARLADALRQLGIVPGDRIAAYMPNIVETAIAMLATTSIGAIWSSCGSELGPVAVLDRLSQIEPKVLFSVDGYPYKGKTFNFLPNAGRIARELPSLEKVVVVPYVSENPDISCVPKSVSYTDFISEGCGAEIEFEQVDFSHPVYIVFSSGTTGKPKCMV